MFLSAYNFPFEARLETGSPQTAQTGILQFGNDIPGFPFPRAASLQQGIAALIAIVAEIDIVRNQRMYMSGTDCLDDTIGSCMVDEGMAHLGHRCGVATSHARSADHAEPAAVGLVLQRCQQLARAPDFAGETVADTDGQLGRVGLTVENDVEMGIERGNFINFRHRQAHQLGQGVKVPGMQAPEFVLQQMQMLDQEIPRARARSQQIGNLDERVILQLPSLAMIRCLAAARSGMDPAFLTTRMHGHACHAASPHDFPNRYAVLFRWIANV